MDLVTEKHEWLGVTEPRSLKQLEEEHRGLMRAVADSSLEKQRLRDILSKKL